MGDAEVAVFGAPLDAGTPTARVLGSGQWESADSTNLFGTYCYELGVDLREQLNIVDIGDVVTIPANIEKSSTRSAPPCPMSSPRACSR